MKKEIQKLSDRELLERTVFWASEERKATSNLIELLREVERRKLYVDKGYGSLHKYCLKELKLSEGSAQRRIDAMRLTADLPGMKEKIQSGEVNLSVAARMQSFFRQESKVAEISPEMKAQIAQEVSGKTCFEAERVFMSHSVEPERHIPEKVVPVSQTHCRVEFTVSNEEMDLFEKVRGLMAHAHRREHKSAMNWRELFVGMARIAEKKLDPALTRARKPRQQGKSQSDAEGSRHIASPIRRSHNEEASQKRGPDAPLEREVWTRDGSRCTNCGSYFAVETDHQLGWALGGPTILENLRCLCHNCNARQAIRQMSLEKREKELRK